MSDFDDYEDDYELSLDDVIEDESFSGHSNLDWSDNLDDMDSGEWDDQYGSSADDLVDEEIDPWALN